MTDFRDKELGWAEVDGLENITGPVPRSPTREELLELSGVTVWLTIQEARALLDCDPANMLSVVALEKVERAINAG